MPILYQEKQPTYFILIVVYIIIALLLTGLILFPTIFSQDGLSKGLKIAVLCLIIINLWLFWSFSHLTIKLTKDYLQIGFGIFKKKFKLKQIKDCLIEDFQKSKYSGYGIRFGVDKSIGYIARDGQGIRIKLAMGRDYFFTTNQPGQLLQLIRQELIV
ncbi:MAG: hypothetical protein WCV73_00645 [Patescibacteria group bacterium]|jgi:hypothetical protein